MKIILAIAPEVGHADVMGLLPDEADEVTFMRNWLGKLGIGRIVPTAFKVYRVREDELTPTYGTMVYTVDRKSISQFELVVP